jgi:diguanylate cyclase (GGDEF)-like protein
VSAETILALLIAAVAANLLLVVAVGLIIRSRRRMPDHGNGAGTNRVADPGGPLLLGPDGMLNATYDRVVRVVGWAVIVTVSAIVVASGLYRDTQTAIFALMAIAAVFLLLVHDVLPANLLGSARPIVEGSVGITIATLLVVLTGGPTSPFFFVFILIVAGGALVLSPSRTLAVTAVALGAYLVGVVADPSRLPLEPPVVVEVAINIGALVLLTYVAMVVAHVQRRSRDAAIALSTIDSLTGLYNRAYFFAAIDREMQRSTRSQRGFCLLMLDLDGLKPINDRFGHFEGDRVLRAVGEIIRHGVRRIDTAARYGGDEFVVLLPETDPTGAYILAEKIRSGAVQLGLGTAAGRIPTSLSIGVVAFPADGTAVDDLMIAADRAMYESKRRGKNQIVAYGGRGAAASSRPAGGNGPTVTSTRREPRTEPVGAGPGGRSV